MLPTPNQSAIQTVLRSFLLGVLPGGVEVIEGQDNRVPEPSSSDFVVFTSLRRTRLRTNIDTDQDVSFTASIAGTLMNVTGMYIGAITNGSLLFGSGLSSGTVTVVNQLSGSAGGTGVYTVSMIQSVPSQNLSSGAVLLTQGTEIMFQLDVHGPNSADNAEVISTTFRDDYAVQQFAALAAGSPITPLYADDPKQVPFINENQQVENRWVIEAFVQADQTITIPQQYAAVLGLVTLNVDVNYPPGPPPPPITVGPVTVIPQVPTPPVTPSTVAALIEILTNGDTAVLIAGMPVYPSAPLTVKRASGSSLTTATVIGLVLDPTILVGAKGQVQSGGLMTLTTTQWAAVTNNPSGLVFGSQYYLDPIHPGNLTATVPTASGQIVVSVGIAISTVDLLIVIRDPIILF